ncbi:hypothetical protein HY003_04090 [Candidatus Saccharibacteria bacterium]|nr:hypothetical protein [Candidatus Saccharibacteria bacterium]MBI3338450.1 hypothetical protein [Candidatus Saccharibacteria bacterium]
MPAVESILSPEVALGVLNNDLLPRLTEQAGRLVPIHGIEQVANPYFKSDLRYKADGTVEGYVDSMLIAAGLMKEPLSFQNNQVAYGRIFSIDLWKDPEVGLIAVSMQEMYADRKLPQRIGDPGLQQLLGRTYLTLATAHSIDPDLLRTTPFGPSSH